MSIPYVTKLHDIFENYITNLNEIKMNPIETTTTTTMEQHSLSKRPMPSMPSIDDPSSGNSVSSSISNNSIKIRDQIIAPSAFFTDKSLIKHVIGVGPSNNQNQYSILKKTSTNIQVPVSAQNTTPTQPNNNVKPIVRPNALADTIVKSQQQQQKQLKQQTASLVRNTDSKSQHQVIVSPGTLVTSVRQSIMKAPTSIGMQNLLEKQQPYNTFVKRPLPMLQHKTFPTQTNSIGMQSAMNSHIIYKTINGHSPSNCTEIKTTHLPSRSTEDQPSSKRLKTIHIKPATEQLTINRPSVKDMPVISTEDQLTKRQTNIKDLQITHSTNANSYEAPMAVEVTQISSSVTLTKTATACKQTKTQPSPSITIEKNGSTVSLPNCPKQGKSIFENGAPEQKMSLDESSNETGRKSLLIKQPSPTSTLKTPAKQQPAKIKSQQSLLKVNSLVHTSPRTKRSKSLNGVGVPIKKRGRPPRKGRHLSTASDGELLQKAVEQLSLESKEAPATAKKETSPPVDVPPTTLTKSLFCNDKAEPIPSSSNSSLEITPEKDSKVVLKAVDKIYFNSAHMNMVLGMLSTFNMITWKERTGVCKQSEMRFQLNELNLVQIAEKCPTRNQCHTLYEKPIFDRDPKTKSSDNSSALYCCRRCECHGAAVDFLAPDFCSYDCFRRESRKRSKVTAVSRKNAVRDRFKKNKTTTAKEGVHLKQLVPRRFFTWASYLATTNSEPAPIDLFPNPFPCGANLFEIGMKLEAIDPEHSSLFCVCTVAEKKGYRLKLKFDGYSRIHNFWVNADSMDIFPPGWCAKTNRVLQPPKGMNLLSFNWPMYLKTSKSTPAPRSLFTHLNSSSTGNPFKVGMRLEAVDLKNTGKVCVATVADVLDNRILIHFDGWDESYDYWIDINSPFIHPIGWHEKNGLELVPPPDWEEYFDWPEYLEFMRSEAAWPTMFSQRDPIEFSSGMKLEVVDFKNPSLIRPATVLCRDEYKVLVHLDGWPSGVTYWVNDDSPDIHPIMWANETGHDLEPPAGYEQLKSVMPCPVKGCRGIGHATSIDIGFHLTKESCPYVEKNWNIEIEKPSRIDEAGRYVYEEKLLIKQEIDLTSSIVEDIKQEPDTKYQKHEKQDKIINNVSGRKSNHKLEKQQQQENVPHDKEIKIAQKYLCDYGPRLRQNYKIFCENSNFQSSSIKKNPLEWTTDETAQYISTKCHPIGHLFKREDIDGAALLSMQQSDLTDILKLKLGPSIKIFSHILHLRNQVVSRFIKTNKSSTET